MSGNIIKVGLVQMAMGDSRDENLARAIIATNNAADDGAKIVCLPELYRDLYFPKTEDEKYFDLAEPLGGGSFKTFSKIAKEKNITVIVPVFEKRASGVYHNSALVIGADGKRIGAYRKTHIPDDPSFHEKFYFTPGDTGFQSFDLGFCKIGVLICWDQWYPEALRITAMKGADIIFIPTAIGTLPDEAGDEAERIRDAWITIQRGHAIANSVFLGAVNRVGKEKAENRNEWINFFGSSFLAGPMGEVEIIGPEDSEGTLIADIDLSRIEKTRRIWPFFRDRRIDIYDDILKRFLDEEKQI